MKKEEDTQRYRVGLVFKARRLLYLSTVGSRVIKKETTQELTRSNRKSQFHGFTGKLMSKVNSRYLSRSQWLQLPNSTACQKSRVEGTQGNRAKVGLVPHHAGRQGPSPGTVSALVSPVSSLVSPGTVAASPLVPSPLVSSPHFSAAVSSLVSPVSSPVSPGSFAVSSLVSPRLLSSPQLAAASAREEDRRRAARDCRGPCVPTWSCMSSATPPSKSQQFCHVPPRISGEKRNTYIYIYYKHIDI